MVIEAATKGVKALKAASYLRNELQLISLTNSGVRLRFKQTSFMFLISLVAYYLMMRSTECQTSVTLASFSVVWQNVNSD